MEGIYMTIVQEVLVRLNTDEAFRNAVQQQGEVALQEYNLSANEVAVLRGLDLAGWTEIAAGGPYDGGGNSRGTRF
jgi:hypothetical protein